jgi:hypothetical protein
MDEARKARLGNRFTCFSCQTSFYDLNKPEPLCPKCGTDQRDTPKVEEKPKRTRKKAAKKKKKPTINPALAEDDSIVAPPEETVEELNLEADAGKVQLEVDSD